MNEPIRENRYETLVASLIYLMTHYARTRCPRLAICIARHMQLLAVHADADYVVRDICSALQGSWQQVASPSAAGNTEPHVNTALH
jgi:hypothetical protein